MRTLALLCSCFLLFGCGNWSNKDLEFLNAMPTREQLRSKLPTGTSAGLSGEGTRRDALGVGEPSKLYKDTKGASEGFNGILTYMIGALELVRSLPPTQRSEDSRLWGPWADNDNPGFEAQVVITRVDEVTFGYKVQHRPKGGTFFTSVSGAFKASQTLRKGSGSFTIHAGTAAAQLPSAKNLAALERIDAAYFTEKYPVTVQMKFTAAAGQVQQTVDYGYQENEDKSGGIGFRMKGTDANVSQLDIGSAWLPSGAGYGVLTVVEGNWKGAIQLECWDAAFNIVYAKQTWPGGVEVGEPKKCVQVTNFP